MYFVFAATEQYNSKGGAKDFKKSYEGLESAKAYADGLSESHSIVHVADSNMDVVYDPHHKEDYGNPYRW